MNEIITEKKCTKCGEWKTKSEFYAHKETKDKLRPHCKECHKKHSKENWKVNSEDYNKTQRKYYKNNFQKILENNKIWTLSHKEAVKEIGRRWRLANPLKWKEWGSRWKKNNPDKARAIKQKRRAKEFGNGGSFTEKEWHWLCEKYGNKCLRCGEHKPLAADHIIPVSKGGTSYIDNIQPLCKSCNSWKGTKTIDFR